MPVAVLLVVRRVQGDIARRRLVLLLAAVLVAQFLTFPEVFATMTVVGAVALALALATRDDRERRRVAAALPDVAAAYAVTVVVLAPFLYFMLAHPNPIAEGLAPGFYRLWAAGTGAGGAGARRASAPVDFDVVSE